MNSDDSADTVIVVSGSLARKEFTSGSDIDWTLLVNGSADPRHYDVTGKINSIVEPIAGKPTGPEGTFSAMVFNHDLMAKTTPTGTRPYWRTMAVDFATSCAKGQAGVGRYAT